MPISGVTVYLLPISTHLESMLYMTNTIYIYAIHSAVSFAFVSGMSALLHPCLSRSALSGYDRIRNLIDTPHPHSSYVASPFSSTNSYPPSVYMFLGLPGDATLNEQTHLSLK